MLEIGREHSFYEFSQEMQPVVTVQSGELVRFHTQDCYGDLLCQDGQNYAQIADKAPAHNPATGPVFVADCKKGDTLAVEIISIVPAAQGVMRVSPHSGALRRVVTGEQTRVFPIAQDCIDFCGRNLTLSPMIGVIGVAPRDGTWDTDTPHAHGGNMDDRNIAPGSVLYLPVAVDGALFGLGDVHGLMGDGEVCICGLELAATVDVRFHVIAGHQEPWPVVQRDESWSCVCSAKTLDEAAENARYALHAFLSKRLALSSNEIAMLLSLWANLSICQVVDPLVTVRMTLLAGFANLSF